MTHELSSDRRTAVRLEAFTRLIPEFIVIYGTDSVVRWASNSAARFLGLDSAEMLGIHASTYVSPEAVKELTDLVAAHLEQGDPLATSPSVVAQVRSADGTWRWLETTFVTAVVDGQLEIITSSRDVHEQKLQIDRLTAQASVDSLTGLANRHKLITELDRMSAEGVASAVLFCDLDGFKGVNDHHGHQVGDLVLREVGSRISSCVGPKDTVARFGGDEFLVALHSADGHDASTVATRIAESINLPILAAGHSFTLSVSIGTSHSAPGFRANELIAAADVAMYRSKSETRLVVPSEP